MAVSFDPQLATFQPSSVASVPVSTPAANASSPSPGSPRTPPVCKFFKSPQGCRKGDQCPFRHVVKAQSPAPLPSVEAKEISGSSAPIPGPKDSVKAFQPTPQRRHNSAVDPNRVVQRPTPKGVAKATLPSIRALEITQLRRRFPFLAERAGTDGTTILSINLSPSDPDFPYDITALSFDLSIPDKYPQEQPTLRVKNSDIPVGYAVNVDRGFNQLAKELVGKTALLGMVNQLDRKLEEFLAGKKAETFKVVRHAAQKKPEEAKSIPSAPVTQSPPRMHPVQPPKPTPSYTADQRTTATIKRESDIRHLEARLRDAKLFSTNKNITTYLVPLKITNFTGLPSDMHGAFSAKLHIPTLYNLEPCTIELPKSDPEVAGRIERRFEEWARSHADGTLVSKLNYLTVNMHKMAAPEEERKKVEEVVTQAMAAISVTDTREGDGSEKIPAKDIFGVVDDEKHNVQFILRPDHVYSVGYDGGTPSLEEESYSSDYSSSEEDSEEEERAATVEAAAVGDTKAPPHGTAIYLPEIRLENISLLEAASLSISVKCERCRHVSEHQNIVPNRTQPRFFACNQCSRTMGIDFRKELVHENSNRLGYLDLDGCTIFDMLPSNFTVTCAECDIAAPSGVRNLVKGDASSIFCHKCHTRLTVHLKDVRFRKIGAGGAELTGGLALKARKEKKQNLGITVGTALPDKGACKHYRKSYRWFRFPCCKKVFACDTCHDELSGHPHVFATRQICGFCSREQVYTPDKPCIACGRGMKSRRTRFWEGGEGMRDQRKMSRKDPRKGIDCTRGYQQ
ncbi:hypothetical protein G7K_1136-t1 [Saitoella complicata NRRL Y-17804]|uniref:CHY-type domain-containing protein n=1 Tax=Saitoella complicata (strain BCRC 22490 / CBS 7301 / JCM 7358 / NBRC 10748 / NRRL Y-17804) TaxID=698492 RepID=A0A0E9NAU6_SAICN|nr:hypothetical protein G7K_1136-t1 [Saitoella complicata NRRL Y-17804]